MKRTILTLICFSFLFCSLHAQTTYTLISNGFWENSTIWSPTGVPGSGDIAIIAGETVYIRPSSGHIQVDSIFLDNTSASLTSAVIVQPNAVLTIGAVHMLGKNVGQDVLFEIGDEGSATVTGNFWLERTVDNNTSKAVRVSLAGGQLDVNGNFIVNYYNAKANEPGYEVYLYDTATLNIAGDFELNNYDGNYLEVFMDNSEIKVSGNLKLNSQRSNNLVSVDVFNSSKLDVNGNISFIALGDEDSKIDVRTSSDLTIEGNFFRPTNFGTLVVDGSSLITYDGSISQTIARGNIANSDVDLFDIANISLANTSGSIIVLEGDLSVKTHMDLTNGVIKTADTALLIIESGATISAGSSTAYVDGPIVKKGSTNGSSFVFPLGNDGIYSPLEISTVTDSTYEYQAQYFSDPPPIEDGITPPLGEISSAGHWSLAKGAGAADVDVSLHWSDAAASGINDPDSLLVAGLKDNGATKTWESYGNGGTTGGTGSGVGGSVTTALSEPPPLDDVTFLTIGTVNGGLNALPVTMTRFGAVQIGEEVQVTWETIAEEDADRFVIERSTDGKSFVKLDEIAANGSSFGSNYYKHRDMDPSIGVNYYRLKQIDYDGRYAYSEMVSVRFNSKKHSLQVYPNPVVDVATVQGFSDTQKEIFLTVEDQNGRKLFSGAVPVESGRIKISSFQLNMDHRGVYYLQFEMGNDRRTIKLIKIK